MFSFTTSFLLLCLVLLWIEIGDRVFELRNGLALGAFKVDEDALEVGLDKDVKAGVILQVTLVLHLELVAKVRKYLQEFTLLDDSQLLRIRHVPKDEDRHFSPASQCKA